VNLEIYLIILLTGTQLMDIMAHIRFFTKLGSQQEGFVMQIMPMKLLQYNRVLYLIHTLRKILAPGLLSHPVYI
jgi:hypothetical protein